MKAVFANPKGLSTSQDKGVKKLNSFFECPLCHTDDMELPFEILGCNHMFHEHCLKDYLNNQVNTTENLDIKCPKEKCRRFAREQLILKCLDKPSFQKYQSRMIQEINIKACKNHPCSQPNCSRISYNNVQKENAYNECSCDILKCKYCLRLRHEGKDCVEALDDKFYSYAKEHQMKFCSKCKTIVTDSEDCRSIVCPRCTHEWCWTCGHEYKYYHEETCYQKWSPPKPLNGSKGCLVKLGQFFLDSIIFILLFPLRTLFWTFWTLGVWDQVNSSEVSMQEKVALVIVSTVINLIYLGCIGFLIWLFIIFPVNRPLLGSLISLMLAISWIIDVFLRIKYYYDEKKENSSKEIKGDAKEETQSKQNNGESAKKNNEGYAVFGDSDKSTQNASSIQIPVIKSEVSISPFFKGSDDTQNIFSEINPDDETLKEQIVLDIESFRRD